MDGIGMAMVVVLFVVIAVVAIVLGRRAREKRRQEMRELAARLGWSFDPESDSSMDDRYPQFGCFTRGHTRSGYNTLSGSRDVAGHVYPVQIGDYTYKITTSNGKTTTTRTYRFSYLIVRVPWASVPDLLVRREGMLDKLKGAMGFDDIDFESEEFSRAFWVKCPDKKFAYDVVHPRMMEFLLASSPAPIELKTGCICITDGTREWATTEFAERLAWMEQFFGLWPKHLTSELGARA